MFCAEAGPADKRAAEAAVMIIFFMHHSFPLVGVLQTIECPNKVIARLRVVAGLTTRQIFIRLHRLTGSEPLELPFAGSVGLGAAAAPARALLHHDGAEEPSIPGIDEREYRA